MKLLELSQELARRITALDHDEITDVKVLTDPDSRSHSLLTVTFASGAEAYVMARNVRGPGIPRHAAYDIPKEAF